MLVYQIVEAKPLPHMIGQVKKEEKQRGLTCKKTLLFCSADGFCAAGAHLVSGRDGQLYGLVMGVRAFDPCHKKCALSKPDRADDRQVFL